jgi:pSer/pThr/pTyr-binding forkhead associated (FHA) protein
MPYQLVVLKGRSAQQAVKLQPSAVMTVGRQDGCQLRIASSQVSRKHCELGIRDGKLYVRDLKSSNGTFVDGAKIEGEVELTPGQVLTVGNVVFRVELEGAPRRPASGKPGDTAVAQAVAAQEDEADYEIEADDQTHVAMPSRAADPKEDDIIELGEDDVAELLLDMDSDSKDKR